MLDTRLDELVALRVMGWKKEGDCYFTQHGIFSCQEEDWQPSRNLYDAMQVAELLQADGYYVVMGMQEGKCTCRISLPTEERKPPYQVSLTLPKALCLAALNVVKV